MAVSKSTNLRDSAFLGHVREDRLYALWHLLGTTGLRRGEALGLRWTDLDLDGEKLAVRQTLVTVGYAVEFSEPKTDKGRRSVDLDAGTVGVLRDHRRRHLEERLALGQGYQDSGVVFTQPDGKLIHPDELSKAFKRHVKAAGLPALSVHGLRHTWASLALRANVHPKIVSERLGDANIGVTLDTYSHLIPTLGREAAATVATVIQGG
ncbi:MAG: site-specific integrase [Actinomycetota bacterium]